MTTCRPAAQGEHAAIMAVARLTPWTRDFGNQVMFSSPASYGRGWVRVAEEGGVIVGFSCHRVRVRTPDSVLYFVGVATAARRRGVGWALVESLATTLPQGHRVLELKCKTDNPNARAFYLGHGFEVVGQPEGYWLMKRAFP